MTKINQIKGSVFWIPVLALSLLLFAGLSWLDMRPEPTLHEIAAVGDTKLLKRKLAQGAKVNELDENGFSPLHHAILSMSDTAVDLLLAAGADINRATRDGNTPLHLAAGQNHTLLAKKLLAAGAELNVVNKKGESPLYLAVESNNSLVRPLLEAGAIPDNEACPGGGYIFCAARSGCVVMLEELVRGLEDVNRLSRQGISALHYAVYGEHADAIRFLIKNGADINSRDKHGWTPLHQAARSGSSGIIDVLVENGVDLETRDDNGDTPLLMAGRVGNLANVRELVARGADINAENNEGQTVDYFALANHYVGIRSFMTAYRRELKERRSSPLVQF